MEVHEYADIPLYNSRITNSYLKLVRSQYPYVDVAELLQYAEMKEYEIADQGHWFSQTQVNRFQEKLVEMTGNPNIAREAGRYSASLEALGVVRQYILGLIGSAHTLSLATKTATIFTRSSAFHHRKVSSKTIEVTVSPNYEGLEKPFQCDNRIGFLEAIFLVFNNKMPHIEHPECMFAGGKVCRYLIPMEKTAATVLKRLRDVATLWLVVLNLGLIALQQWNTLRPSLLISMFLSFTLSLLAEKTEKRTLKTSLNSTMETNDKLLEQVNINYNNSLMTNEIAQGLGTFGHIEDILTHLIDVMQKRLSYDRGVVFLANPDRTRLVLHTGYGYLPDEMSLYERLSFHLDRPRSKGVLVRAFREQRPFLVNDLNEIADDLSPRSLAFARKLGAQSFVCCPVICEGTSMGVLAVDNVRTKKPLVGSDLSLLMGIASVTGISVRNAQLVDARVRVFKSIIQVLAASIDARDPLTAGHSEKVTEYSLGICRELGLAPDFCGVIRVAALLHDYGKLGVPDTILKKKGPLTDEEYEVVKGHSRRTSDILSKIDFEGMYCEVPEIAGSHHEKLNGSGYPKGLKGAEIPLGARIIAVADYFEAVTAKRHYHEPISAAEAFELLRKEVAKGHLEEQIVRALARHYTKTYGDESFSIENGDPLWPTFLPENQVPGEGVSASI